MAKKKISKKSGVKKRVKSKKEDLVFKKLDSGLKSRFASKVEVDSILKNIIWFGIGFVFFYLLSSFSYHILYQRLFLAFAMVTGLVTISLVLAFFVVFFLRLLSKR